MPFMPRPFRRICGYCLAIAKLCAELEEEDPGGPEGRPEEGLWGGPETPRVGGGPGSPGVNVAPCPVLGAEEEEEAPGLIDGGRGGGGGRLWGLSIVQRRRAPGTHSSSVARSRRSEDTAARTTLIRRASTPQISRCRNSLLTTLSLSLSHAARSLRVPQTRQTFGASSSRARSTRQ